MYSFYKSILTLLILLLPMRFLAQDTWNVKLGQTTYVNISHVPHYRYIPDGHISVLPEADGRYTMYWSEFENARTTGATQFLEDQKTLDPDGIIFGGRADNDGPSNGYNDGGSWLMSVHRHNGDTLVGFYHGESHWYPRDGDFTAWKSICVAYSYDNGYTWDDQGVIVTSDKPKPESRTWGGAGDCCVVWDSTNNRWNCYHQEHNIRLAVSYDPMGAPGTWKKYYQGEFNEEGLGGMSTPLDNLSGVGGANPSVHWNTFYSKWVMTYHGWDGGIYVTLSSDGLKWDSPVKIISKGSHNRWYPTIIGETDTKAGRLARLYYAEFNSSGRNMAARDILFDTTEIAYGNVPDPWEAGPIGSRNFNGQAGQKDGVITITGTTNKLFEQSDQFYYMYQEATRDGSISTRLTSQTDHNNKAFSGIMLRSTQEFGSPFISMSRKSGSDTVVVIYREFSSMQSNMETIAVNRNWLKIKKEGDDMELLSSEDGSTWESEFSVTLQFPDNFLAGLFSTSHEETRFCTATFENTTVSFTPAALPRESTSGFRIYPNPARDKIRIQLESNTGMSAYQIIDMTGKIYERGRLKGDFPELNIEHLPPGRFYVVRIFEGDVYVRAGKVFKQ